MTFQAVSVTFGAIALSGALGPRILGYPYVSVHALVIAGGLLLVWCW